MCERRKYTRVRLFFESSLNDCKLFKLKSLTKVAKIMKQPFIGNSLICYEQNLLLKVTLDKGPIKLNIPLDKGSGPRQINL